MKKIQTAFFLFGFVLIPIFPAFSQNTLPVENPVRYDIQLSHAATQPAALRIVANDEIHDIDVLLNNCAAKPVKQHIANIPKGENYIMQWSQSTGTYNCQIQMRGKDRNGGTWKVNNTFQMHSLASLGLKTELAALSPDINTLTFHASQPVARATLTVKAEDGSDIDHIVLDLPTPQKDMTMTWQKSDKVPAFVEVRVDAPNGVWSSNTFCKLDNIPHEDIIFDSGKATIRKDQEQKLLDTLHTIESYRARFDHISTDLYITGYTDTVGSLEHNDKLSRDRAKAIAHWMRKHNLNFDVYYRGLGERVLIKGTPDETPEEVNRRVQYTLSNYEVIDNYTATNFGKWNKL